MGSIGLCIGSYLVCYLNVIDLGINVRILKFADNTKLFNCVGSPGNIACLRNDLHNLCHLSEEWFKMLFLMLMSFLVNAWLIEPEGHT